MATMVLFEGDGEMKYSDGKNNYLEGRGKNEGLRKFLFPLTETWEILASRIGKVTMSATEIVLAKYHL